MVPVWTGSWRTAISATLHCLTGCAIGEVLGMVLATWWGWGNGASIVLAVVLAFFFGYLLTFTGVRRAGRSTAGPRCARRAGQPTPSRSSPWRSSTTSSCCSSPAPWRAGLADPLFWWSLAVVAGRRVRARGAGQPLADRARQGARGRAPVPRGARRTTTDGPRHRARISAMRMPRTAAVLVPLMLLALGCAPQDSSTATDTATDADQTPADCAQGNDHHRPAP